MSLLCRLSTHVPAPQALCNQGFAFSKCRRCGHDMIRSVESPETKWRTVPAGFRVAWKNIGIEQAKRGDRIANARRASENASLIFDFLYIAPAALYWTARDYLSRPARRREVIRRISAA